ncbi:diacylglycerol kinase family protein [uncultured Fibrobacter sp.]|uniref:diacylglycerol/lipid kinase family protein n=1 Tax=uncultured Fibrobacter sp. TaxID=261512 RepID=UPI0025F4AD19|nr:diacylglycerol kinase family protein [uncultured Fibrobacter sp.]
MYKFFFLINPVSGGGQGKVIHKFLPEIMESMDFKSDEWKSEFTRKEGMDEQILTALSSTETLVAVGGDGTVSSVLSIMLESRFADKVQIGLIPLGTGNDLARVLGLYKPFVDKGLLYLVRRLLMAKSRPFDIWTVNGKYALANYFSAGIDARIAHDFNQDRATGVISSNSVVANKLHYVKRFFADRAYYLKRGRISMKVQNSDHEESVDLTGHKTVIVGNIPSFASGANPFFKSNMADGYLEVVCVPNMLNFLLAIAVGNIPVVGYIMKKYLLKSHKVRSLQLDLADDEYIQLDGEDLSGKVGEHVTIAFASQVRMLTLEE